MPILEVRDITVRYPESAAGESALALDRVSLSIDEGDFVVAIGRSGCGKTTLQNLLAGFLTPSEGRVPFDGADITGPSAERGVVFQNDALLPWLDAGRNVEFGLRLKGVPTVERRIRAAALLASVGLAGAETRPIWELSGGQQQRLGLARALAASPRVLLMDEPLGALDVLTREMMQTLLLDVWARTRCTIVMITHGIDEAVFLATRLVVMSPGPGRIVAVQDLAFGRRYVDGETPRAIRSDPSFAASRETILGLITAEATVTI